jgi:hypothetical protein
LGFFFNFKKIELFLDNFHTISQAPVPVVYNFHGSHERMDSEGRFFDPILYSFTTVVNPG